MTCKNNLALSIRIFVVLSSCLTDVFLVTEISITKYAHFTTIHLMKETTEMCKREFKSYGRALNINLERSF